MEQLNEKSRTLNGMSMEELLRTRDEARTRRVHMSDDLETLMKAEHTAAKNEYLKEYAGIERAWEEFKESVGFGRSYQQKKVVKAAGNLQAKLNYASSNISTLMHEVAQRGREYGEQLTTDTITYACNHELYGQMQRRLAEKQESLEQARGKGILPAVSSETFALQRDIQRIKADIDTINYENNELTTSIIVRKNEVEMHRQLQEHLQTLFAQLEEQRSSFSMQYQLALANQRLLGNVRGAESIKQLYMLAGVQSQKLEKMRTSFSELKLPSKFKVRTPSVQGAGSDGPFWLRYSQDIL